MPTDPALDKAAALADHQLTPYRGKPVVRTSIAITNAGDGLSNAMRIEPKELEPEETVYVVLECTVAKHQHVPIPDTGTYELGQSLKAGAATLVDADLVRPLIEAQKARIQAAKDEAAGQVNLEGNPGWLSDEAGDEEPEALVLRRNHMSGNHAQGLMEGCPLCDQEQAAMDAEAAGDGD
ncbi:MAG: hypothetical protein SHS37scaffold145_33 [Phage 71_18]|nr:MAG: hypothetical protein SHS37scaffold145_33 [Phage 71_18]